MFIIHDLFYFCNDLSETWKSRIHHWCCCTAGYLQWHLIFYNFAHCSSLTPEQIKVLVWCKYKSRLDLSKSNYSSFLLHLQFWLCVVYASHLLELDFVKTIDEEKGNNYCNANCIATLGIRSIASIVLFLFSSLVFYNFIPISNSKWYGISKQFD